MKKYINNKEIKAMADAAALIKSGDSLWISGGAESTECFAKALAKRAGELKNVTVISVDSKICDSLTDIRCTGSFRVISGVGEAIKQTYDSKRMEVFKGTAPTIQRLMCEEFGVNVLVAEISHPDHQGLCATHPIARSATAAVSSFQGVSTRIALFSEALDKNADQAGGKLSFACFDMVCELDKQSRSCVA